MMWCREGKNRGHEMYGTSSQDLDITDKQSVYTLCKEI